MRDETVSGFVRSFRVLGHYHHSGESAHAVTNQFPNDFAVSLYPRINTSDQLFVVRITKDYQRWLPENSKAFGGSLWRFQHDAKLTTRNPPIREDRTDRNWCTFWCTSILTLVAVGRDL